MCLINSIFYFLAASTKVQDRVKSYIGVVNRPPNIHSSAVHSTVLSIFKKDLIFNIWHHVIKPYVRMGLFIAMYSQRTICGDVFSKRENIECKAFFVDLPFL